jgi:hypothetical protein
VRHVGFLVGLGRPAGDAEAPVQTVDQVIALLRRPIPSADELTAAFDRLHANEKAALSKLETQVETDLFDALTALFVDPARSGRARKALTAAVGESRDFGCVPGLHPHGSLLDRDAPGAGFRTRYGSPHGRAARPRLAGAGRVGRGAGQGKAGCSSGNFTIASGRTGSTRQRNPP